MASATAKNSSTCAHAIDQVADHLGEAGDVDLHACPLRTSRAAFSSLVRSCVVVERLAGLRVLSSSGTKITLDLQSSATSWPISPERAMFGAQLLQACGDPS